MIRALRLTSLHSRLKTAYFTRNGVPTGGEERFYTNRVRSGPASADQSHSTASQGSRHVLNMPAHLPLSCLFFASAKQTDSVWPKSDDAK